MATSYITPNMNLIIPVPLQAPGPDWATELNASMTILDAHTHSPGSGVQITPQGLNINTDLTFQVNNAINLRSSRYSPNVSPLSLATDLNCIYVSGVDFYLNDGNGNQIRVTQSGSLAGASGTITGLPSGTASASYAAGTFTFQSATLTSANIDAGSYIFRNNVASSFGLTLQPPTLSNNYSLTLPALPGQTNVMTLSSTGVMASVTYDQVGSNMTTVGADAIAASMDSTGTNSIIATMSTPGANQIAANMSSIGTNSIIATMGTGGANSIAFNMNATGANAIGSDMTAVGANPIAQARTRSTGSSTEGTGGVPSSGTGGYSNSGSFTSVTSVTLTTSGRPVVIGLSAQNTSSYIQISGVGTPIIGLQRNGSTVWEYTFGNTSQGYGSGGVYYPPSSVQITDFIGAGTYTYNLLAAGAGAQIIINDCLLLAYEL